MKAAPELELPIATRVLAVLPRGPAALRQALSRS